MSLPVLDADIRACLDRATHLTRNIIEFCEVIQRDVDAAGGEAGAVGGPSPVVPAPQPPSTSAGAVSGPSPVVPAPQPPSTSDETNYLGLADRLGAGLSLIDFEEVNNAVSSGLSADRSPLQPGPVPARVPIPAVPAGLAQPRPIGLGAVDLDRRIARTCRLEVRDLVRTAVREESAALCYDVREEMRAFRKEFLALVSGLGAVPPPIRAMV